MRGSPKLLALVAVIVLALSLAACGSSGGDSSAGSSTASTATEGSTAENAADTGGSGSMAEAEERLKAAETPQKKLALATPLKSKPKPGQTLVVMQCDNPNCTINTNTVKEAAKLVDFNVKVIPFQFANPATLVAGMKTALQYDPIATLVVGLPQATWSSVIPEYEAKGVAIVGEGTSPATLEKSFIASIPTTEDAVNFGRPLADWIAVDSEGEGKALFEEVPELGNVELFQQGVEEELGEVCPECEMKGVSVTLGQIGSGEANQTLISQLRSDPSTKYLVVPNGAFATGLTNTLKTAGLQDIKVLGISPENEQFAGLENGTQAAWNSFSIIMSAYQAVDAALRYAEGGEIPTYDGVTAAQLITEGNVGSLSQESKDLGVPPPFDLATAFGKLWMAE